MAILDEKRKGDTVKHALERPWILVIAAVVFFAIAGILNVDGHWGEPRQAIANIAWMLFLASVAVFILAAIRLTMSRARAKNE